METIKEARERRGIKQYAVADHIGITRQTYAKYEENPDLFSIEQAKAACDFIGVNPAEIFFGKASKTSV